MNDEQQLSQPSDAAAAQRGDGSDTGNGVVGAMDNTENNVDPNTGPDAPQAAAPTAEEATATDATNQTGGPGGLIGGAGAPLPEWPPETEAAGTSSVVQDEATADALASYHPGAPVGGTPDQAAPEEVLSEVAAGGDADARSEEHTSELQSRQYLVCR